MRTKIFLKTIVTIIALIFLKGCTQSPLQATFKHFNQNKLLDKRERAYAKRVCQYLYSGKYSKSLREELNEDTVICLNKFDSDLYDKWGLERKGQFSREDKLYLTVLEKTVKMWEEYNKIDLSNLDVNEKTWLKELDDKYNKNRRDLRETVVLEKLIDLNTILTGRNKIEDRIFVLWFVKSWRLP